MLPGSVKNPCDSYVIVGAHYDHLGMLDGKIYPGADANASGVFFGITSATTHKQMAYAVMEGVAFSLYHIYENMGFPEAKQITIAGGAAKNRLLCKLKASLFDIPVLAPIGRML